jgi:hypothetical protein
MAGADLLDVRYGANGNVTFLRGNQRAEGSSNGLSSECAGIGTGGCTSGAHLINVVSSRTMFRMRNMVVHELGHAFKWAVNTKTGLDVYHSLGIARDIYPSYPNRETYTGEADHLGPTYGFASPQNQFTWQQSLSGEDSEEFADQFLGYTFNMWATDEEGIARSIMMNSFIPLVVNLMWGR